MPKSRKAERYAGLQAEEIIDEALGDLEPDDRFLIATCIQAMEWSSTKMKLYNTAKLIKNERMTDKDRMILREIYLVCQQYLSLG